MAWRHKVIPELEYFPTPQERRAAIRGFWRTSLCRREAWLYWLIAIVVMSALTVLFDVWMAALRPYLPWRVPYWMEMSFRSLGAGLVFGLAFEWLWRKPLQRWLRERLVERGMPMCIACGYDLRGQTEPRCPECGRELDEALLRPKTESNSGDSDS